MASCWPTIRLCSSDLHVEELLGLFFGEAVNGDTSPLRENLGDLLFVDHRGVVVAGRERFALFLATIGHEVALLITQLSGPLELLRLHGLPFVTADAGETLVDLLDVWRQVGALETHPAACLVDEVDGLVRQVAVGDVPIGEVGGVDEGLVGEADPMMVLVAGAQPFEDLDGVRNRGLVDLDRLEATLERRVLLEVLPVLLEGGGADRLQLAAREHRLEDAGGVDCALCGSCADQRVNLVDEQDDVAARTDLLQHLLEAFLEVAAVPRACDKCAEVERVEVLVGQRVWHIAADDALRQAFDDGRLADTRLTDQNGVVLRAARQHLHDPLDLLGAPDDRVELPLACQLGEVATELIENSGSARSVLLTRGAAGAARMRARPGGLLALDSRQQLNDCLADLLKLGAELLEHLGGHALTLADEPEEDVLRSDVVVAELKRFTQRQLEDLLGAGRERDVPAGSL